MSPYTPHTSIYSLYITCYQKLGGFYECLNIFCDHIYLSSHVKSDALAIMNSNLKCLEVGPKATSNSFLGVVMQLLFSQKASLFQLYEPHPVPQYCKTLKLWCFHLQKNSS